MDNWVPQVLKKYFATGAPAEVHQWTGPSLVRVMACRQFGAKPLPEPKLAYCQLDPWEHISVKYESEFCHFHSRKCNWKCRLMPKWWVAILSRGGWVKIKMQPPPSPQISTPKRTKPRKKNKKKQNKQSKQKRKTSTNKTTIQNKIKNTLSCV